MNNYKWTGEEKHLFDFKPKFKIGDRVIIHNYEKLCLNDNVNYPHDYAYIYDINVYVYDDDNLKDLIGFENVYRLENNDENPNMVLNHHYDGYSLKWWDVLFLESNLELISLKDNHETFYPHKLFKEGIKIWGQQPVVFDRNRI